jgi:hypothetical protein
MIKQTIALLFSCCLLACHHKEKIIVQEDATGNNYVVLRRDTVNVVKVTDTLLIPESTCRGCAYEVSTKFLVTDSLDIVKMDRVITTDNTPPDVDGGNISKDILLTITKPGSTRIHLYKFWREPATADDSALYTPYFIDARN